MQFSLSDSKGILVFGINFHTQCEGFKRDWSE